MRFILTLMTQISVISLNSAHPYNLQLDLTFQKRVSRENIERIFRITNMDDLITFCG